MGAYKWGIRVGGFMQISYVMVKKYDNLLSEIKLIEEYMDIIHNSKDRQIVFERYVSLIDEKLELEASFKELKKWGTFKCVA
jgi:phage-related protein